METTAAVVVPEQRLGKRPPKFDPRTFRLARYIEKRKLPTVPQRHTLSKKTLAQFPDLGQMANNRLGCCTIAALGHAFQGWTTYGKKPWRPTDEAVVHAYNQINGGVDQGAFMLDALNLARHQGIDGNRIYAYVAIEPQNADQIRTSHFLFGGLYVGAALPVSAQDERVWTRTEGPGTEPWTWGGHAMNVFDYKYRKSGEGELVFCTWGDIKVATTQWARRYMDEAYAVLEEDYVGEDRRSPQGFGLKRLAEDLARL